MKALIIFALVLVNLTISQEYRVLKVQGDVKVMRGTSENYEVIKREDMLRKDALVLTGENSYAELESGGKKYFLAPNSALPLDYIKEMTIGELLLALAMEDIRNVPKEKNGNPGEDNTAVYGSREESSDRSATVSNSMGTYKINGAKWLAENGYEESSIILAKETYRKYPDTGKDFLSRIYFADLLFNTGLYEETLEELNSIQTIATGENEKRLVKDKIELIKRELLSR